MTQQTLAPGDAHFSDGQRSVMIPGQVIDPLTCLNNWGYVQKMVCSPALSNASHQSGNHTAMQCLGPGASAVTRTKFNFPSSAIGSAENHNFALP